MEYYEGKLKDKKKLSVGCRIIDRFLNGGICCGEITEITGEASAGKTQLCLQLLIQTVSGPTPASAVYLHTEGDPPLDRLRQICHEMLKRKPCHPAVKESTTEANLLLHIYIEHTFDTLNDVYQRLISIELLLKSSMTGERPVKLLVIDSIAYLCRDLGDEGAMEEVASRSALLFRISSLLRKLAYTYDIAVVCTNHVVDFVDDDSGCIEKTEGMPGCGGLTLVSQGRVVYPALGLAWSNCINTRLFVFRKAALNEYNELCRIVYIGEGKKKRHWPQVRGIQVVFSPCLPQSVCFFHPNDSGITGLLPGFEKDTLLESCV